MPDAEIDAMGKVAEALGDLGEDERGRVLRWAAERYGVLLMKSRGKADEANESYAAGDEGEATEINGGMDENRVYEHFAELYDSANPSTDAERVLVAAYWIQYLQGKSPYGSQDLNKVLKDLGHGVGTINKAMSTNIKKRPALILQVSRSGSSQQARKKYKLTDAGKKWVEGRID